MRWRGAPLSALDDYISDAVRTAIADRQTTAQRVALAVGMTQPTLSRRLRGVGRWGVEEWLNVADVLNVDPEALIPDAARVS